MQKGVIMDAKITYSTLRMLSTNAIDNALQEILRTAARVYVLEAYKHIRVDTGMSMGTLVPLAHAVGASMETITPKRSTPEKNAGRGANQSYVNFYQTGNTHTFEWSTSVFQYYLNERFPLRSNNGSPWKSLKHGSLKVKQYLRSTRPEIARALKRSWTREERSL